MSEYKVGITFNAKTGQFKSEVKQVESSIAKIGTTAQATNAKTNQLNSGVNRFGTTAVTSAGKTRQFNAELAATNKHAHGAHGSLGDMIKSMAIMSAVMGTVGLGAKLVTDLATFQDLRTQLRSLSKSAVDYADKEGFLIDLAKEHHKELAGLASGYAGLTVMVKEGVITDDQARKMLAGLSNGASQTGASAENLKQIFYGLNQTLGQGTVQAQELNQVVEPMPGLLSKLAKAAGQETGSAFRKLVGEGKVTSEMFAKYMVKALQDYDGAAARTANNINAKFADISTAYLLLAKNLETPINNALLPVLHGLAGGLNTLGENADTVSNIVFGAFVIATGHAATAIAKKTMAVKKDIITNQASAISTKRQAQVEHNLALAYKASAVGSVQNNIADKRLTASKIALTAATEKANIALKVGSAAMGFLGGPVGVAMLAAWAITSFAMSAADAARESVNLADKVGLADKKLTELTTKQLRLRLFNIENDPSAEIDKARLRALRAKKEYNKVQAKRGFKNPNKESKKTVIERDVEIEALQAKLDKAKILKAQIKDLLKKPDTNGKPQNNAVQDKNTLNAFAQQRDALIQQLALLGKTTELAKAEYATTYGKYSKLLPVQKAELIALAKTIDYKNKSNAADVVANNQAKQLASSANSYGASLQRKISLSGKVTEVQRLNYEIENGSLQGINDKLKEQLLLKAQLADQAVADTDKQLPFWEQLKENIQQTTTNFDAMWGASFNNFAQGIGDATATAIVEGQNFGQTMKTIARSAIKEVISGLVQMGVKYIALEGIKRLIGKTGAVAAGGTMLAEAQASSLMAGINAFASTAAIPIVGPGLAPGAMTAALAVTTPMVAGVAGMTATMVGMAHEGIDSIPREGTWLLDKGERIVDSRTNQDLKTFLNKAQGGGGSNIVLNYSPVINANDVTDVADVLEQHQETIYNLIVNAKADRGEDF